MTATAIHPPAELPSDEERELLRNSVRGFLATHWPPTGALERSQDCGAVARLWAGLVGQGLASLGSDPAEGGLREITLVMEELGRAACPAPMLGAALANLLLGPLASQDAAAASCLAALHQGQMRLAVASASLGADSHASSLRAGQGMVDGSLHFVDAAPHATHLLAWPQAEAGAGLEASTHPDSIALIGAWAGR